MKTKHFLMVLMAAPLLALAASSSLYDFTVNSLAGKPVALKTYKGKVALVVNVASQCGFTPQYTGLQNLYDKYSKQGLVVLGFPCNDFGGQEPGSSAEIQEFCSTKFKVTFPMFEKVSVVKGADQAPLYQYLTAKGDVPSWNFCKYLIDRQGRRVAYFNSTVKPDSDKLTKAIEAALQK